MVVAGTGKMEHAETYVYHEKQESGRMCGQHVINMLLQRPKYGYTDLVKKGENLDSQESMLLGINPSKFESQNFASDGYFSIGVLENILKENDLKITPLANPIYKGLQTAPQLGEGYLVGFQEHWFAFRKIKKTWYRLDSLKASPLSMTGASLSSDVGRLMASGATVFVLASLKDESLPLLDYWAYDIAQTKRTLAPFQTIYMEPVADDHGTCTSNVVDRTLLEKKDITICFNIRTSKGVTRAINGFSGSSCVSDFIKFLSLNGVRDNATIVQSAPPRKRFIFTGTMIMDGDKSIADNKPIQFLLSSATATSESFVVSPI